MTDPSSSLLTERVSLGGVELFVRYQGEGPSVIVLHGGPGADHTSLLPQFDALARGRRLIYYDQRGGGQSRVPGRTPLDWHHHVADLDGLLEYSQIRETTLLGYSWGALLALLYAIAHPDRVASLALISPAPATAKERRLFERRFAARMDTPWARARRAQLEESDLRHVDPAAFRQQAFELSVAPYFKRPDHAVGTKQFLISTRAREAAWRSLGAYDFIQDLTRLDVQALVLHGRHDPIPIEAAERIATLLEARFEVFEDSGHLPYVEEYDRFVKTVDGILPRLRR